MNCIDFPDVALPTKLQSSKEGAKFLSQQAQSLSYHANVALNDSHVKGSYRNTVASALKQMKQLDIPPSAKDYVNSFTISPVAPVASVDPAAPSNMPESQVDPKEKLLNLLNKVEEDNASYSSKEIYKESSKRNLKRKLG